jgi:hypothetical protein
MESIPQSRKLLALKILRSLLVPSEAFTGDILYDALIENGFTNDESGRLVGSLIRKATSNGWIRKTENWAQSSRNKSNIQIIWKASEI